MDIVSILVNQIVLMFILMGIGVLLCKSGKLSLEGSKTLGNVLLYLVIPTIVIKAYMTESTPEKIKGFILSLVLSLILLILAMLISRLFFKNDPIEHFGA